MSIRRYIEIVRKAGSASQPVREAYAAGFKGYRGEQCDVFRNPTRKEYREALAVNDSVRAFLVGDDILIWNTFSSLHQTVRDNMRLAVSAIPLVMYGAPGSECGCQVTDNTRGGPWWHNGEVADAIESHPYLRRMFQDISVCYYDEAIVGDWRDLGSDEDDDEGE